MSEATVVESWNVILGGQAKRVADAANGLYQLDFLPGIDLFAERPDIHIDRVGERVLIHPDTLQNHLAGQYLTFVGGKRVEKIVLPVAQPDLDTCPALRSIGTVFPNPWEINKYRKENLYPEAIRDRCETILMPRGSGLYSELNSVGCGQDFFGVLFSGSGQPSLAFSYDFDARIDGFLSRARKRDPGEVSVTLLDYRAGVFGTYRYNDTDIEDQDDDGMATLLDLTLSGDPGLRDDKKAHSRVAILDGLGSGLHGQLAGIASPVLETPGFFACERAELHVAGHNDKRWLFVPIPEPVKSSGAPKGDVPIVDGPDALPEEPPVMGPLEKPGDSGHAK